jgi:hypothetical protein
MHNEQPFYIGQKVVCVEPVDSLKKDIVYTVAECLQCSSCKLWHVILKEFPSDEAIIFPCSACPSVIKKTYYAGARHTRFAPIQHNYFDITASLAQDAVQERLDVVKPLVKQKSIT